MRRATTITRQDIRRPRWMLARGRSAPGAYVAGVVDPVGIRLKEGET